MLDVGRTSRTVTPAQRDALAVIWGGCARDGCDRPPDWTEGHHARPWRLGGRTDLDDLLPFCVEDHHGVHDLGLTLRLKDGRWIGPDGWVEQPPGDPPEDQPGDPPGVSAAA